MSRKCCSVDVKVLSLMRKPRQRGEKSSKHRSLMFLLSLLPYSHVYSSLSCTRVYSSLCSLIHCHVYSSLNCKNSAQSALEVAILRSKIKKNLEEGALHCGEGVPSPHPTSLGAFGASIIVPVTLDLAPPLLFPAVCKSWIRHCMQLCAVCRLVK